MEVAAIVSSINPAITPTIDSVEMGSLQQELLWMLYNKGHLAKYPMAVGNLGDLEEISPLPDHPPPIKFFQEAIDVAIKHYNNQHVYPYTYLGGYLYRKKRYKEAIHSWAEAASVIKGYNYTREDEEIYKEFLEIASDFIPNIVRNCTKEEHSADLLQDPAVYADLLRFYDGICEWEEGSSTPVLHVGWAQYFTFSLQRFDPQVRFLLDIHAENDEEDDEEEAEKEKEDGQSVKEVPENMSSRRSSLTEKEVTGQRTRHGRKKSQADIRKKDESNGNTARNGAKNMDNKRGKKSEEDQLKSAIEELVSKVGSEEGNDTPNPSIAALAQACSSSILNKDFLLGEGEPFALSAAPSTVTSGAAGNLNTSTDFDEFLSTKSNGTPFIGLSLDSMLKAESPADMMLCGKRSDSVHAVSSEQVHNQGDLSSTQEHVTLELRSEKMKGLKKILKLKKLNANAIKLQLTAQSQVHLKHVKRGGDTEPPGSLRKRSRRE